MLEWYLEEFQEKWISALKKAKDNNEMTNYIFKKNKLHPAKEFEWYTLRHIWWEALAITKDWHVSNTMSGIGFDILPKQWNGVKLPKGKSIIKEPVVVNFKSDYVEFYSLKTVWSDERKEIKSDIYEHLGMATLDYSKYGTCIKAQLDPNKNFIVWIFENWNEKTCNVIRLNEEAELMSSTPWIKDFLWFNNAFDVVLKDDDGNIRILDTNFVDYERYLTEDITRKDGWAWEKLTEVLGRCDEYPKMFSTKEFTLALSQTLEQNKLIQSSIAKWIMISIAKGRFITEQEQENFKHILDPDNQMMVQAWNELIDSLDVQIPKGRKRWAPVYDLILDQDDNPDAKKVITELRNYVDTYSHVLDVEKIKHIWDYSLTTDVDWLVSLYVQQNDSYKELIQKANSIDIHSSTPDGLEVEFEQWWYVTTAHISPEWEYTDKVIMSDRYVTQPTFDADNVWIAKSKEWKYGLVITSDNSVDEATPMEYDQIDSHGDSSWYLLKKDNKRSFYDAKTKNLISQSYEAYWFTDSLATPVLIDFKKGKADVYIHEWDELVQKKYEGKFTTSAVSEWHFVIKTSDKPENHLFVKIDDAWKLHEINNIAQIKKSYQNRFFYGKDTDDNLIFIKYSKKGVEHIHQGYEILMEKKNYMYAKDSSWKIYGYDLSWNSMQFLDQEQLTKKLFWSSKNDLTNSDFGVIQSVEDGLILTDYEEISKWVKLWKNNRHWLKTTSWEYVVGKFKSNQRTVSEWINSKVQPLFTDAWVLIDNDMYLFEENRLQKIEHDFDSIEFTWEYYIVTKNQKYWISSLVNNVFKEVVAPTYDKAPEMKDSYIVIPSWDKYELHNLEKGEVKEKYTFHHEPQLDFIRNWYVTFDVPSKWIAITSLSTMWKQTSLSEHDFYDNIREEKYRSDPFYILEKKDGSSDYIIDGQKMISESNVDLIEIYQMLILDNNQYLIIWKNEKSVYSLYFSHENIMHKIDVQKYSKNPKEVFTQYEIRYKWEEKDSWWQTRNKMIISFYGTWVESEYFPLIIKEMPDDPYISFRALKEKKRPLKYDDIEIEDGILRRKQGSISKFFTTNNLEDDFEEIKNFWI